MRHFNDMQDVFLTSARKQIQSDQIWIDIRLKRDKQTDPHKQRLQKRGVKWFVHTVSLMVNVVLIRRLNELYFKHIQSVATYVCIKQSHDTWRDIKS